MRLCFVRRCSSTLATVAVIVALASQAYADPMYTITDLTPSGDSWSDPTGINNSGEVVGVSENSGFLYSNGTLSRLDPAPRAINDLGQTVQAPEYAINNKGDAIIEIGDQGHGVLVSGGVQTNLGTLGGSWSMAVGINDSDQVVGQSETKDGTTHAFVYSGGKMMDLGLLPGTTNAVAYGINNAGQIVGGGQNGAGNAFLYQDGKLTNLGSLGHSLATEAIALSINNSGQIVGWSQGFFNSTHAFLYSNGTMYDLNRLIPPDSGWTLLSARGINNSGQIIAEATKTGSAEMRAVLLTPVTQTVPEPSTLAIFGILAASVSLRARWRKNP